MSGKTKAELQAELLKLKAKLQEDEKMLKELTERDNQYEELRTRNGVLAAKCIKNDEYIKLVESRNDELDMKIRVLNAEKFEINSAKNAYAEQATMWQRKFHNKTVWDCFCQWFNRINTK